MSADRLPLLVAYGEGDDGYEEEEEVKADDFELRAMVDGHVLSHGKSERRPTTGTAGQAGEESSTPSTPAPAPRCLPTARGLGYLLSGAVLACMFIFFGLVVGVDSTMRAGKVVIFLLSVSDALIALSYFFIPGAMFAVVLMRKDIAPYVWIVWMFGAFIVCCGLTHAISAIRPWAFSEWVMVVMKIVTAAVSYATAIAVYRIIPLAMLIPSPIQLELEINERKAAQGKLQSRYERSVVTNQVTREIRRNLQLGAICRATAEHCAELFNADECTLYQHKRKSPKPAPAPEEQPTDERDSQCQGADCAAQPCREEAASTTPQEVKDHRYSVLSEHTKHHGRAQEEDGAHGPTGEEMEPVGTRQRRHSALKRDLQRRAPPLHLLPGFLCQHRAVVIDVVQGLALTHQDGGIETDVVDEELLNYFRERDVAWVMCIALPYHATSCAAIVLQVKNKPAGTPSTGRCHWWSPEDIEQLEEISAQVEIGLAHAHLLQEAERGRQLTNLNLALTQAKAEAEAGSKAKSQFLAVVSHEIRTPMNAICGMTKVLKDSHMSSEQRECVQIISSSAKALLSLLNNILDFSKIEAGKTEIDNTPFDIRACIQNIMGLMANYAGGKHNRVTLSTLTDSRVPYKVVGDKQHLRQVLINLLSNALKFTQVGSVTLRTSLNSAWTDPDTHESMADIRFEVTDTGIGIPQEKLDSLFHPFSQVDSGFTRKYEGTGLGLAISMRLCKMMGGSMWVQSQENKGSTFGFNVRMRVVQMDGVEPTTGSEPESDDAWSSHTFTPPTQGRWEPASSSSSSSSSSTSTSSFTSPSFYSSFSAPASPLQRPQQAPQTSVSADAIAPPARYRRRVYTTLSRSVPAHIRPLSPLPSPYLHHRAGLAGDERISASLYQPKTLGTVPMTSPLRLLLAEDNLVNQKVAFKLLSRLGYYNVVTVANGRQAVESITAERAKPDGQPFDAVLMDLHMPEMDGITASRTVKMELRDQAPYIIACTADLQYDTRTACAQAGIDNYLEKPIKLKDLAKVLEAAATHRLRRQGAADRTVL